MLLMLVVGERFYGPIAPGTFKGKKLFFIYQGAAPTKMMLDDGEYTMSRFAGMYGFTYEKMAKMRTLNKEKRFFNMDYKQAEQFVLNWKMDD